MKRLSYKTIFKSPSHTIRSSRCFHLSELNTLSYSIKNKYNPKTLRNLKPTFFKMEHSLENISQEGESIKKISHYNKQTQIEAQDKLISPLRKYCKQAKLLPLTDIQERAIIHIKNLPTHSHTITSGTGSGKTYAFLLPLVNLFKLKYEKKRPEGLEYSPSIVIFAPSRELVLQTTDVLKQMSHSIKFRSVACITTKRNKTLLSQLRHGEIVVTTPKLFNELVNRQQLSLKHVKHVAIDEADNLIEYDDMRNLLQQFSNNNIPMVFAQASYSKSLNHYLRMMYASKPEMINFISSDSAHRFLKSIKQEFIHVDGKKDKIKDILIPLLKENAHVLESYQELNEPTLIFCNTVQSARAVQHALKENKFSSENFHGKMPDNMANKALKDYKNGALDILVTTDIVARGIDIPITKHVINFDFPLNPVDWLHRSGRTGRNIRSPSGKVTNICTKKDLGLANAIEQRYKNGFPMEDIQRLIQKPTNKGIKKEKRQHKQNNKEEGPSFVGL